MRDKWLSTDPLPNNICPEVIQAVPSTHCSDVKHKCTEVAPIYQDGCTNWRTLYHTCHNVSILLWNNKQRITDVIWIHNFIVAAAINMKIGNTGYIDLLKNTQVGKSFILIMYYHRLLWCITGQHIEAETKWPIFRRRHFQAYFLQWKCLNFD